MSEAAAPEWVATMTKEWQLHRRLVVEDRENSDGSVPALQLTLVSAVELDLSPVPPGAALELWVQSGDAPPPMTLHGLAKDARCRVVRLDTGRRGVQGPLISLAGSVYGPVEVSNPKQHQLQVGAAVDCVAALHLVNDGTIALAPDFPQGVAVAIMSGTLHLLSDRRELTVRGHAVVVPTGGSAPSGGWTVENLHIDGASTLALADGSTPRCTRVTGRGVSPTLALQVSVRQDAIDSWSWSVSEMADLSIETNARLPIDGVQRMERVEVRGPAVLRFGPASTGDQITFSANDAGRASVAAGPSSVLAGLRGTVDVGVIKGANLAGGPEGFEIAGLDTRRPYQSPRLGKECLEESVLTGFKLPRGLQGRQLLSEMIDAYHVDPHTDDLPGWDRRWCLRSPWHAISRLRARRRAGVHDSHEVTAERPPEGMRRLHHDAEFMRELQRLVIEKGAPGSTRTKVAWCAYRLRHLTTTGIVERLALSGYRILGYGERPVPAFATWLTLAVLGAAAVLGWHPDFSVGGAQRLALETLTQASGPLAGVMRSGSASLDHEWEYLIRAVVAVPLITGLLALRNYVKSGRD